MEALLSGGKQVQVHAVNLVTSAFWTCVLQEMIHHHSSWCGSIYQITYTAPTTPTPPLFSFGARFSFFL